MTARAPAEHAGPTFEWHGHAPNGAKVRGKVQAENGADGYHVTAVHWNYAATQAARKEREAARKRPLVPARSKLTKEERRKRSEQRLTARAGLEAGDERYLPLRDKGPQKRMVRDIVDSRFTVGEFMIPLMFAVIIVTFLPDSTYSKTL